MPVRSSNSSVLRWPDRAAVASSLAAWARAEAPRHAELLRLGYFGSYARGDWGPGSDVDLVAVVAASPLPFERRAVAWDLLPLPVPADLLVYTAAEWDALLASGQRFARTLERDVLWVWP
jgi:nucleotidyltransferase-like protein